MKNHNVLANALATLAVLLGLTTIIIFIVVGIGLVRNLKYGNGEVLVGGKTTFYREVIKEEAGCIYFVDIYGDDTITCGNYTVKKFN